LITLEAERQQLQTAVTPPRRLRRYDALGIFATRSTRSATATPGSGSGAPQRTGRRPGYPSWWICATARGSPHLPRSRWSGHLVRLARIGSTPRTVPTGHARGTARHLPHVLSGSVIRALRLRARPLVHRPSTRDQVNQRTQPWDDDDEEGPHGFSPSGQVMITENIGEDRDEHPDPGEQEHEPEDRKQNVPERYAELRTSSDEHVERRAIESSAFPLTAVAPHLVQAIA
jgi:hypothetical protein